jgi:membrane-associated phospholipid phosphatase
MGPEHRRFGPAAAIVSAHASAYSRPPGRGRSSPGLPARRRCLNIRPLMLPRSERRPAPHALLLAAAALAALAALAMLAIDRPVARLLAPWEPSAVWARGIESLEWAILWPLHPLASSFALVAAMLAAVAVPRWRAYAPAAIFLAGTHVFARYLTGQLKDLTGRLRPSEWIARGGEHTFFRDGASFPSGHVALFASLVVPIAILWPRARPALAIVGFVAAARIAVNAHFVSDTLASGALIALVAWAVGVGVRPLTQPPS